MPSALSITVSPTRCRLASPHTRLAVLHNTGSTTVRVGDARVTPTTGTAVAAGATVEYRHPDAALYLVATSPTTVEVTYLSRERDVVSHDTGVPAELLDGRNEAELRASADRIAAWKVA